MNRLLVAAFALALAGTGRAEPPAPTAALARMPVKEVTVFKDGHAYVVHQGAMPTDAAGNVVLDLLPNPVLGTFWPYSLDKAAKLESVTAGRRRVAVERTALTLREMLEANAGAEVVVAEGSKPPYTATIVKLLARSAEELDATTPPTGVDHLPVKGSVLLLKTADGTRAVPVEQVTDVKFVGKYVTTVSEVETRNLLTLKLNWAGQPAVKSAEVGMAYVQKGVRWIPNYRVELGADGTAVVKMQATLLNELADLKDATVNLVVGVPSFYFKDTADPIGLEPGRRPTLDLLPDRRPGDPVRAVERHDDPGGPRRRGPRRGRRPARGRPRPPGRRRHAERRPVRLHRQERDPGAGAADGPAGDRGQADVQGRVRPRPAGRAAGRTAAPAGQRPGRSNWRSSWPRPK